MSDSKVQLLWSRSSVYIHPTKSAADNIAGYLSLIRPAGVTNAEVLVSWIPESLIRLSKADFESYMQVDLADDGSLTAEPVFVAAPPTATTITAASTHAFSISIGEIFSMQIREPSLGWWYGSVLLFTRSQITLPALFFHDDAEERAERARRRKSRSGSNDRASDFETSGSSKSWGGEVFIEHLKTLVKVVPSTLERGVFLINPGASDKLSFSPAAARIQERPKPAPATPSAVKASWEDVKWSVFQKLAQVTRVSRKASQRVLDRSPAPVRALLNVPEVEQLSNDFDSARVYLAEWALGIAQDTERRKFDVVWSDGLANDADQFSLVNVQPGVERRNPVTLEEWQSFFDDSGRLCVTVTEVRERIFHGGLEPPARPDAWLFLLGVYPWDSDQVERQSIVLERRNEYYRLKRRWWDDVDRQQSDDFWKDQKSRIEKDVLRTDRQLSIFAQSSIPHPDPTSRFASSGANPHLEQMKDLLVTYNEYNENLGYVQGMTDLLSPLYVVLQDDSLAFWAFCAFMNRMERNFLRSQQGMRDQLKTLDHLVQLMLPALYEHLAKAESTHFFFFFRMILVWYKREFEWDDVLRMWEVLWTDYLSSQFHIFVALAILDLNKEIIMGRLHHFDEILKYINDLGMSLDVDAVLVRAEQLFNRFVLTVEFIDRQTARPTPGEEPHPRITDDVRQLLSQQIVEVREEPRPYGATGG